jgi:PAS domain S-box-containing protein
MPHPEAEHLYRALFSALPTAAVVLDPQGRIQTANMEARELLQALHTGPGPLEGRPVAEALPWLAADAHAFLAAESLSEVLRREVSTGSERRTMRARLTKAPERAPGWVLVLLDDVSGEGTSAEELRRSLEHARQLIRLAATMIVELDLDGTIRMVNDTAARVLGYATHELLGQNWFERVTPRDRYPETYEVFTRLRAGELVERHVNPVLTRAGEERFVSWRNTLIREGGVVAWIASFGNDITQRRKAEAELHRSEERNRTLLESLPQHIFFKDPQGRFITVNEPFARDFNLPPAELVGKTDHDLFPAELADKYRADDIRVMEARRTETIVETNVAHGESRYVEVVKAPVIDADGEVAGVLGVFTDITERVRAEQELQRTAAELTRSNEELEQFAYVASHDLQEPLRMVASYTQLLGRRYRGKLDADADEFIHYAVDGATRMQGLINDLLAYSRVGTQGRPFEETELDAVLDRALANLQLALEESAADVERGPLPRLTVDPVQMVQLFQNLVGNALKFRGDAPARVRITAEPVEDAWQFAVRDRGIGIEPAYFERIFIIFQRLHGTRQYAGTGIGLSICKKIVNRHGGRIWVESEPGQGSVFYFTLPIKRLLIQTD